MPGEVLVLLADDEAVKERTLIRRSFARAERKLPGRVMRRIHISRNRRVLRIKLPRGSSVRDILTEHWPDKDPRIKVVEPNYRVHKYGIPNDARFRDMWDMNNTGQTGGKSDADIDAPEAWEITQGADSVVVAVIDTGIDYLHPELRDNIWFNPGEIAGNGIDDDGNGYIDDIHGYDFVQNDGDPSDADGHGTHVAGTIAARGDNGIGVAGLSWHCRLMACRFLDANGSGTTADAIEAINYAVANGAKILNNSWGGGGFSAALEAAIKNAQAHGVLFVAAAGNLGTDNDVTVQYPASYSVSNIIAVAATDRRDRLATFSNYGSKTVHLGAPGVSILSTYPDFETLFLEDFQNAARPGFDGTKFLTEEDNNDWGTIQNNIDFSGNIAAHVSGGQTNPYPPDRDASIIIPALDTRGRRGLTLQFDYRYEVGPTDSFTVEVWDGNVWRQIFLRNSDCCFASDFYYQAVLDIPEKYRNPDMQIRFHWKSNHDDNNYYGVEIDNVRLRCLGEQYENAYSLMSGTSMAAPHVTGVAALLLANYPDMSLQEMKSRIMLGGDEITALQDNTQSHRRLNAYGALTAPTGLQVNFPDGGETLGLGKTYRLKWSSIGGGNSVDIYLRRGKDLVLQIANKASNTGVFLWHVPVDIITGGDYKIAIDDGTYADESDGDFTITETASYYTEQFMGGMDSFDLAFKSLLLTPRGNEQYDACVSDITALPTDNMEGATVLSLGDDDFAEIAIADKTIPFYDEQYSRFFIGSNGYITFVSGNSNYTESAGTHFDLKRISGLFDDLNPTAGGEITWKQLADRVVATWLAVPQYDDNKPNTFQIEMFFDGRLRLSWLEININDGMVGISRGDGVPADFEEDDISALNSCGSAVPKAYDIRTLTKTDTPLKITLQGVDDGLPNPPGALAYIITSLPRHGFLYDPQNGPLVDPCSLIPGFGQQVIYTPKHGFIGRDVFTYKVNDGLDKVQGKDSNIAAVTIMVDTAPAIFREDFEDGLGNFTIDNNYGAGNGLWHISTSCRSQAEGHTATSALYYGVDEQCNYDAGKTEGAVISPLINLQGVFAPITLRLKYFLQTENMASAFDKAKIQIAREGGPYQDLLSNTAKTLVDPSGTWRTAQADISGWSGTKVRLRFSFTTNDRSFNDYPGFYLDDIAVLNMDLLPVEAIGGDINNDGRVDIIDLARLSQQWLSTGCSSPDWCEGTDLDQNGLVNLGDFVILSTNWLKSLEPF